MNYLNIDYTPMTATLGALILGVGSEYAILMMERYFKKQEGNAPKFSKEQMEWLYMLKDQIAHSIHADPGDLDYTPFDAHGGRGRMWQLFGGGKVLRKRFAGR